MKLSDFFVSDSKYWTEIRELCIDHVLGDIKHFEGQGKLLTPWSAKRFGALIQEKNLDLLIQSVKRDYRKRPNTVKPQEIKKTNEWFIAYSVFPTIDLDTMIDMCPGTNFESILQAAWSLFKSHVSNWRECHFAHWIVNLERESNSAMVSLDTYWSQSSHISWFREIKKMLNSELRDRIIFAQMYNNFMAARADDGSTHELTAPYIAPVNFLSPRQTAIMRWRLQNLGEVAEKVLQEG